MKPISYKNVLSFDVYVVDSDKYTPSIDRVLNYFNSEDSLLNMPIIDENDNGEIVERVSQQIRAGYTVIKADGYYESDEKGKIIKDEIKIVRFFLYNRNSELSNEEFIERNRKIFLDIISQDFKKAMPDEDCIIITENRSSFVYFY